MKTKSNAKLLAIYMEIREGERLRHHQKWLTLNNVVSTQYVRVLTIQDKHQI